MLWRRRRNSGSYPYLARLGIGVVSAPEPVRRGDYKAKSVPLLQSEFENDHCCGEGSSSFLPLKKRAGIVQGKHHLALHVLLDVHTEAGGASMEERRVISEYYYLNSEALYKYETTILHTTIQ